MRSGLVSYVADYPSRQIIFAITLQVDEEIGFLVVHSMRYMVGLVRIIETITGSQPQIMYLMRHYVLAHMVIPILFLIIHIDEESQRNPCKYKLTVITTSTGLKITFKFFTEVLFLSIILCLANTGIVNVLVSTLYSKPDEVTGYECGLYSTKGGRLKDRK